MRATDFRCNQFLRLQGEAAWLNLPRLAWNKIGVVAREASGLREPFVPKEMFFTKGHGKHKNNLQSFEEALRDAGIAGFNLVRVSSIYPPHCRIVPRAKGLARLKEGEIVFCVLAECRTNEPNRLAGAGIGLALPGHPRPA